MPDTTPAHTFSCAGLISAATVSRITGIQSVLVVVHTTAGGPKVPKGETACRYQGTRFNKDHSFVVLVTDVTILTGAARDTFDGTWSAVRGSGFVAGVKGVGSDAAWDVSQLSLYGYEGRIAFAITLEPLPLSAYPPKIAEADDIAIARMVVGHL